MSEKKTYISPAVEDFGTVTDLTAAIGSHSHDDQSEFPEQFPPDHGSFDVCHNDDPSGVC